MNCSPSDGESSRITWYVIALSGVLVLNAACQSQATVAPPVDDNEVPVAESEPEHTYKISGVTLIGPLTIQKASTFTDGGTVTLTLVDIRNSELRVCHDGRLFEASTPAEVERLRKKPRHVYVGGTHPTDPKARPVPIGGRDERELHRALQDWMDRYERTGELRLTPQSGLKYTTKEDDIQQQLRSVKGFLARLAHRQAPAN